MKWKLVLLVVGVLAVNAGYLAWDPVARVRLVGRLRSSLSHDRACGFIEKTHLDPEGAEHRYMVFVPPSIRDDERLPLLVYLNGHGENGHDPILPLKNGLAHAIWEDVRSFPYVAVWPQCDPADSWETRGSSTQRAIAIMHEVAQQYHTDPDRVYLTGISSGGTGTWAVASQFPNLFAAIVPVSAVVNEQAVKTVRAAGIPVWAYAEVDDSPELVRSNRVAHRLLLEAGQSPHLTEVSTRGDRTKDAHDAWSFAYRDGGMYRWLAAQNRTNRIQPGTSFEWIDLSKMARTDHLAEASDPIFGATIRVPADGSGCPLNMGRNRPGQAVAEIHLEFMCDQGVKRFGIGPCSMLEDPAAPGAWIELSINDLNAGGLFSWPERRCVAAANSVAERAHARSGWNDLRCRFEAERTVVELNGWPWIQADHPVRPTGSLRLDCLARGDAGAFVEVRNLRVRWERSNTVASQVGPGSLTHSQVAHPLGLDAGPSSGSLETVFESWRQRELARPDASVAWEVEPGYRYATAAQRREMVSQQTGARPAPDSQLTLRNRQVRYSAPWSHARLDVTRKVGLRDARTVRDYQREFKNGFRASGEKPSDGLRLCIACDDAGRVDWVTDRDGRGLRGIEYSKPDVWRDRVGEIDDLLWRGPLLAYRPLANTGVGCNPESCVLQPEMAWCGGVRCAVVDEVTQANGGTYRRCFWADPARGYLILRSTVAVDDVLREQIDVQYVQQADGHWAPSSWEVVVWPKLTGRIAEFPFAGNEWLFHASRAQVIDEPAQSEITITEESGHLPPGTIGFDQRSNQWFEQLTLGERRPLSSDEVLAATASGIDGGRGVSSVWWGGGLLLVMMASGVLFRLTRKRGARA